MAGVELIRDRTEHTFFAPAGRVGTRCRDYCFNNNVIIRAVADTMIMSPPLVITRDQIDRMVGALAFALDQTHRDLPELMR
jgi:putrescine aminotransferase